MSLPDTAPRLDLRPQTPDGVGIAAEAFGPEGTTGLIFIHGFSQAGLCWSRQVASPALAHLPMVTYDFRGHGASDKPFDPAFYQEPHRWADEVETVRRAFGIEKAILVGWSYAGRIIGDYLAAYGTAHVGGIVFVDAVTSNDRAFYGSCNKLMRQMCSPALRENIAATIAFLERCVAIPQDPATSAALLGFNMVVPPQVRAALFGRATDYESVLAGLDIPVLVTHGAHDAVVAPAMACHIAATVPGAQLLMFEDSGHAPFLEEPEAFNAALAAFAATVLAAGSG